MITVLRLGHRRGRDQRISSHVGLTARQFGADKIIYSGEKDDNMLESLRDVSDRWGGNFKAEYSDSFRNIIRDFEGVSVHLTMYGKPFKNRIEDIKKDRELLVVVGSEKVPRDIYDLVDFNLAVGNQPHSEVAAIAIFLYEINGGEIPSGFEDADIEVVPSDGGKKTVEG
ncbi:MAG: tRNA (cytidine(56)-2'-O)-methyltransferase [Candidatus Nanohaloarchaea archaeon]|nr:tRNA (cytidine(56)-2'-O)-methyltransferase [Candidatus Nanohaloarchaea archaeon]